ncbi:MAG: redoxin domain-containing protein [Candidatus Acidiferrales bacterium]
MPASIGAILLSAAIAFAQTQGQAAGANQATAQNQETNQAKGIQPDLEYPILPIGAPAPDFDLPGVDGKNHKLGDYAGAKVLAIVFECDHCPVSQLYEDRTEKIYRDYKDKGVALVAINPNNPKAIRLDEMGYTDVGDSLADMKIRAAYRHIDYPYLYDGETQAVAMKFGVVATPHIFIFDRDRKLRYQGGIDDNMTESLVKSEYARNAIDALLAGQPVAVETSRAFGCSTKWMSKSTGVEEERARIDAEPVSVSMANADDLKKLRANPTGKLLLVNFWATWCGPCITEFPDLQDTYRMYRNRDFTMVTVSENDPDAKDAVLKFLQKMHASTTNLAFASADTNAMQDAFDPKMGAAVPFTLLIGANGDVLYQEQGDVTIVKLRRAILANLPDTKDYPGQLAFWSGK